MTVEASDFDPGRYSVAGLWFGAGLMCGLLALILYLSSGTVNIGSIAIVNLDAVDMSQMEAGPATFLVGSVAMILGSGLVYRSESKSDDTERDSE